MWDKTASDCDRCSVMGEAVRFGMPCGGNEYTPQGIPLKILQPALDLTLRLIRI